MCQSWLRNVWLVAVLLHVPPKTQRATKYRLARDGLKTAPYLKHRLSVGGYKMRPNWIAPVAFVLGLSCAPAWAITVEVVKGEVSVKQGEGFRKIAGPTEVYRGDKVMAAPGGQAKIVYANGCVVPVGPGGVATVGECKQPMTAGLEAPSFRRSRPTSAMGAHCAGRRRCCRGRYLRGLRMHQ